MNKLLAILFVLISSVSFSQTDYYTFTHEDSWLQPESGATSKEFIKIKIGEQGIYRLGYSELLAQGFSFTNENQIKLYRRGIEQAIYIEGNGDGLNSSNDYIEFYGDKNDGQLDEGLYIPNNLHENPYYSLFTDTAAYFLCASSGLGKRTNNFNSASQTPESYYIDEQIVLHNNSYNEGLHVNGAKIRVPFYSNGEGWYSTAKTNNQFIISQFDVSNISTVSETEYQPIVELLVAGNPKTGITAKHFYKIEISDNGSTYNQILYDSVINYNSKKNIISLTKNQLGTSGNLYLKFTVLGDDSKLRLGYVKLNYAKNYTLTSSNSSVLILPNKPIGSISSLQITNVPANNILYLVDNLGNHFRKISSQNDVNIDVLYSSVNPKLYIDNQTNIKQIASNQLKSVNLKFPDYNKEYVIVSDKKFTSSLNQYSDYRESQLGGNYSVGINYIDELYDVFTYGDFSPLAIRRFSDYLISNTENSKYMLLIGKGLALYDGGYGSYRLNPNVEMTRGATQVENCNFVPAYGNPGSDLMYTTQIRYFNNWFPEIPIGRISAISNEEVIGYLNKVKEYESAEDDVWKKRILHLGGGNGESEINTFKSYLKSWENIAKGEFFGADVSSVYKSSTNAIQEILVDEEVNKGVRLITFFGHSTSNQSQIDIGRVSDISKGYDNRNGKFPVIILNGCNSGNFYYNSTGFGEDWVVTPEVGAIAFISSSTTAFAGNLKKYTDFFYETAFQDTAYLESTVGNIIQRVNRKLNVIAGASNTELGHYLNINLLGDPAVPMFSKSKADLETNNSAVFLQPIDEDVVTAVSDSFNVGIVVRNFGKYSLEDSFFVSIERSYNGTTVKYPPKMYNAVANFDTLYYGISSPSILTYGLNTFKIHIDFDNNYPAEFDGKVVEVDEYNNEAVINQVIPLSAVFPIFPKEFGIIGLSQLNEYNQPWILTAQSTDLMVDNRDYIFQIDTTKLFNSSLIKQNIINGGAVVSWDATQELNSMLLSISNSIGGNPDSVIFYWRVKYNNLLPGEEDLWGHSSFMYNYQSPGGWAQAHYFQFLRDNFNYLDLDSNSRKWKFESIKSKINYSTTGPDGVPSNSNPFLPSLTQDQILPGYIYTNSSINERGRGLLVNVFDGIDLTQKNELLQNAPTNKGIRSNGRYYYFRMMSSDADYVNNFVQLISEMDDGDYIAITTKDSTNYSDWPQLNAAFAAIGAQNFPPPDSVGYAIMGRKNGTAVFEKYIFGTNNFDTSIVLSSDLDYGIVTSTIIGPSTSWKTLYRNVSKPNIEDEWGIDVYGYNNTLSKDTLLASNVIEDVYDIQNINSDDYPYLQLKINKEDKTERTPPQLNSWLVSYEAKIPEGIIIASKDIDDYSSKEYYEGEKRNYNFRFQNISKYDFKDSLIVKVVYVSEATTVNAEEFKIKKPAPNEYTDFTYEINTRDLGGNYFLQITVNPNIEVEHYYHNNSLSVPFKVFADDIHPILDVTFDDTHIMDYDIVSPKTSIKIRMKDENNFLFKTDREGLRMQIQHPINTTGYLQTINMYDESEIKFIPADEKHDLEIIYNKKEPFLDGEYELIVQVEDEVGNKSGTREYRIHFTVINETSMTHFIPYPNPFSTSMRFAYTLTGSEQPDRLKIQIMTISGKIVREISQFELGPLKIGKHLTDFVWDGTDEFGSKLANGVYLYRVIADVKNDKGDYENIKSRNAGSLYEYNSIRDSDGKEVDKEYYGESKTDELFKKGWGKIYIMR